VDDREGGLQAREAQPEHDRDRQDPNRNDSLTMDHDWREVVQTALDFVERFVAPKNAG
jgi:hypothetical protein